MSALSEVELAAKKAKKEKKRAKKKAEQEALANALEQPAAPAPVPRPTVEEQATTTTATAITGTFEPFWARAVGDFTAVEEGDLTIRYHQLIEILDMQPNGWWAGRIDGRVGWLPSNHVERVDPMEIFLTRIGLMKVYSLLVDEDIDMDSLRLLTDEDLSSIGMKLGPRKALLKALADTDKVRRLSQPRDISHQDVKRSMSKQYRTGENPDNTRVTKDKEKHVAGSRVRTSQFIHVKAGEEASEEAYIQAAVYLKIIIPEQNLYKILSFEGSMKVKDMIAKTNSRLAQPLKKNLKNYAIFMPDNTRTDGEIMLDSAALLGTFKPQNMSVMMLRTKPTRSLFSRGP